MTTPSIWIGTIEITGSNKGSPTDFRPAFTNITKWASNASEFREKCVRILTTYGWNLVDVERAAPLDAHAEYGEEIEDMMERTKTNPNANI